LQKISALSHNHHGCYYCVIITQERKQKWLKAYLNGNTSHPILFCIALMVYIERAGKPDVISEIKLINRLFGVA
jgi:hypothetical protein